MKVALVHDDFTQVGGAENLFATIAQIYPEAPIYTSQVNWSKLPSSIEKSRIRTSFMQKIPFGGKFFKALLPLYPFAFESFNFSEFDLVISSSTRFAKSIVTKPGTVHIAYTNSIPRFLYDNDTLDNYLPRILKIFIMPFLRWLRRWDRASARRADYYIANSTNVSEKLKKTYDIDSQIVYPFANTNFFTPPKIHNWQLKSQNYFLIVSRLVKWKRIDLAIAACKDLNKNLIIVGSGPDKRYLESIAKGSKKVTFEGRVTSKRLKELYQNAKSLIVTQEEDFGISAVEAQSCGIPVISFALGGTQEIITNGKTGIIFDKQTKESAKDAIASLSKVKWSQLACRKNSLRFSKAGFVVNFKDKVDLYARHQRV